MPVRDFAAGGYVLFATKQGTVKKTELEAYSHPRAGGIQAIGLDDDDRVMTARRTDGQREVMIATKLGMIIRFSEEEVRPMGRGAGGVKGNELDEGDEVIAADVVQEGVRSKSIGCRAGPVSGSSTSRPAAVTATSSPCSRCATGTTFSSSPRTGR